MKTDELIASLAAASEPLGKPRGAGRRMALPLALGMTAAVGLVVVWLGLAPPMTAMASPGFWLKLAYGLLLGAIGLVLAARLARPGMKVNHGLAMIVPGLFLVLLALGLGEVIGAPVEARMPLLLGHSWTLCAWLIVAISAPIYAGAIIALRRLAPTRPALAGAAAGLAAGGLGAAIYALHCPEYEPAFIAVWYSLGIAATTVLGAVIGARALRW